MIRLTHITTTDDIIELLGGIDAVARLASTTHNAVYNWLAGGQFPADTYLLIQDALEVHGRIAPDELWPMRQPGKAVRKRKASRRRSMP